MYEVLLFIIIGFFAAFMSSMSGAGTALFSIPLLLIAGVPVPVILAANQVSSSIWTPIASKSYLGKVGINWSIVLGVGSLGLIGVCIGISIIEFVPIPIFKRIMGGVILFVIAFIAMKKDFYENKISKTSPHLSSLVWGLPLGLYQSIFGAASMFSSLMFCKVYSFDLRKSLAYAYAVAFPWCLFAAVLYYVKGWVDWSITIPFTLGSVCGAFLGSKLGSRLSTSCLRKITLVFGFIMGVRFLVFA